MKRRTGKEAAKPMKKTTLNLDADLHKRLRILAIEEDTSMTALVEKAVESYIAQRRKGGK
jgi:predicted transcriptional regulator